MTERCLALADGFGERFRVAADGWRRVVVRARSSSPAQGLSSSKLEVAKPSRPRGRRGLVERQYVGVDLHAHHGHTKLKADYRRIADRRGKNIARTAVARKLLTLVYYGLRDG